jgi:hypothetical protein
MKCEGKVRKFVQWDEVIAAWGVNLEARFCRFSPPTYLHIRVI